MRPSSVQAKSIIFTGLDIAPEDGRFQEVYKFDWNDVNIRMETGHRKNEAKVFAVYLRIVVNNSEGKQCPYKIDVRVFGLFEFIGDDAGQDMLDLIVVNGTSILYSSIREMVTMVTSRMPHGAICIPGMNFLDHKPSSQKNNSEPAANQI